jgi:hypothetical protein
MQRNVTVVAAVLLALSFSMRVNAYTVTVQKGTVEIVRSGTGEQIILTDTGTVNPGDLFSLTEGQAAAVAIEKNAALLLKGPSSCSFSESGNTLSIALENGQILLNRKKPYKFSSLTVTAKGFTFVPLGTCAAVKTSREAPPTTAVVSGKIRMQSPSGEAVVVDKGNYGSAAANGRLVTGALSARAIGSLNEWAATVPVSGTETPAASPEVVPSGVTSAGAPAASGATAAHEPPNAPTPATMKKDDQPDADAAEEKAAAETPGARKIDKTPAPPTSPKWEISAGTATIDNVQWTRLALGVDVPIWKFGIFFDLELFIDNNGQFSDKGWNFSDDWLDALTRKIRYLRFGQEGEPVFVKFGGLSSVTMGYGFLVDRFTNMLHYPDQKLLGLQFDLNDISPIGITLQTLVADFKDFDNDGGVVAARLGLRPLKMTGVPIVKGITVSGSYATDLNQYAPARKWKFKEPVSVQLLRDFIELGSDSSRAIDTLMVRGFNDPRVDNEDYLLEKGASTAEDPFGLIGGDIGIPIIATSLVGLDLYGQAGIRDDGKNGWGIGAPGVALKVWRIWANVEYRRVQGLFQPGYFGTYYLDERLIRDPQISTKEQRLVSDTLNGVFGRLGFNIADVLLIDGSYQYMTGRQKSSKDQRFEAAGSLGELLLSRIPKLNRAEVYYYKSRIGNDGDKFFEKTPFMYWGYRAGFEIAAGASLIFDTRYGYKHNGKGKLVSNNNISVQTAVTF